ncbi:MAG: hypothetical protein IJP29_03175 [Lachnospiraceae bacterium]|nr:hypothetical protein [Lachnospiraceae bacterium]
MATKFGGNSGILRRFCKMADAILRVFDIIMSIRIVTVKKYLTVQMDKDLEKYGW